MKKLIHAIQTGVLIGVILSIITSLIFSKGDYYPMNPVSFMGEVYYERFNETIVMLIAVVLWAFIGILFTYGNNIFTKTDWSFTKQTIVHFLVMLLLFLPLAFLAGWFPINVGSIVSFIIIFIVIYVAMWIGTYQRNKHLVTEINNDLKK